MFHFGYLLGRVQEESFALVTDWAHAIKQQQQQQQQQQQVALFA